MMEWLTAESGSAVHDSIASPEFRSKHGRALTMQFAKQLRDRVVRGEITCSIRVWQGPRVKAGGRYSLGDGHIVVDRISQIEFEFITPALARKSGFASVPDLLRTAVHGPGRNVYLVEFHYET